MSLNRNVSSAISARLHRQVEGQRGKKPDKDGDKSAVAKMKDVRQLGFVFRDTEPPESSSILRKSTKGMGSIRRRFTQSTLRQANIRENRSPSLNKIHVMSNFLLSAVPETERFEDRSQETERQERCARGDAWRLAKNVKKLKERENAMSGVCRPHPQ